MATSLSPIPIPLVVDDIAVAIDRSVPAQVTGQLVYAVTGNNNLISFDSDLPGIVRTITPTSGVFAAQPLVGLDFRPATGELFGLGYNNTTGMAQLYSINLMNGAATAIGTDSIMLQPAMGAISMDFNPTVDRIRVVGRNGANFRLNPMTGALAATDLNLNFAVGDANQAATPNIGTVAYTNSFNGSTTTTMYDYDLMLNVLATQIPPNNGTLNTIGASGIMVNVGGLPTQQLMVSWLPSTDPDGNLLVYVVQVATDVDFNNIIYMKEAGEGLFTTMTYGEVDALLVDNGIGFSGSLALYTRIEATDASNATASQAVETTYTRGPSAAGEPLSQQFDLSVSPNITDGQAVTLQINATKSTFAQVFLVN